MAGAPRPRSEPAAVVETEARLERALADALAARLVALVVEEAP